MHVTLLWFRRDLRLADNRALIAAIEHADSREGRFLPLFIWDPRLYAGARSSANRTWYLRESLTELAEGLASRGSSLLELTGAPERSLLDLVGVLQSSGSSVSLFLSADHTPYARRRDLVVREKLATGGVAVHEIGGPGIVEPDALIREAGTPYRIFTPYHRAWRKALETLAPPSSVPERLPTPIAVELPAHLLPDRESIAAATQPSARRDLLPTPGESAARARADAWFAGGLADYTSRRDLLAAREGTSRLSPALHLGLLSARELAGRLVSRGPDDPGATAWLRQLAWRDFYTQVLAHAPYAAKGAWRPEYDAIEWEQDPKGFAAWCEGRTGYPVIDAAMRELRQSGLMHNRARMIVASFLVKDLLIDWRKGEAHFMRHLVDGDVAANNGGWQWSAGSGTDAQPYFRILNPVRQSERFDPHGAYLRRWLPELAALPDAALHAPWEHPDALEAAGVVLGRDYPFPIVDHAVARARALERFGRGLKRSVER
jgi:deoxyribodipyrimidine photo-lyase